MLWQRLLFGSLMIVGVIGLVLLDARVSMPAASSPTDSQPFTQQLPAAFPVAALPLTLLIIALVVLSTLEMGRLCRAGGFSPATAWAAFVAAGLVLVPWIEMHARFGHVNPLFASTAKHVPPTTIWIVGGLLGTCLTTLARKTTERAMSNTAITVFIFLYLGLLGSFWTRIRCLSPGGDGAVLLVYVLMTVKSSDIGAYFTGMAMGKHKLCPWLSPGKTVEGAVGAVIGAVAISLVGIAIWPIMATNGHSPPLTMPQAVIFGILMAISGHLGDLVESAFKRDMHIKDSGHLVPAFGGLLDLVDSPLFAAPVAWLALTFWGCFDYN